MARDAVTITDMAINTSVVLPAGTAITAADGAYIDADHTDKLLIALRNTAAGDYTVTFKAGGGIQSLHGDLVVTITNAENERWIVIEGSRFIQDSTGYILLDFHASFTGTVAAVRLPVS